MECDHWIIICFGLNPTSMSAWSNICTLCTSQMPAKTFIVHCSNPKCDVVLCRSCILGNYCMETIAHNILAQPKMTGDNKIPVKCSYCQKPDGMLLPTDPTAKDSSRFWQVYLKRFPKYLADAENGIRVVSAKVLKSRFSLKKLLSTANASKTIVLSPRGKDYKNVESFFNLFIEYYGQSDETDLYKDIRTVQALFAWAQRTYPNKLLDNECKDHKVKMESAVNSFSGLKLVLADLFRLVWKRVNETHEPRSQVPMYSVMVDYNANI